MNKYKKVKYETNPIQSFLQEKISDDINRVIKIEKEEIGKLKIQIKDIELKINTEKLLSIKKQLGAIVDDIYRQIKIKIKIDKIKELADRDK